MFILRIEHSTSSFEQWKRMFDSDPVGRARSGVRAYRIMRPVDDAYQVMIELEFDTSQQAEALLAALHQLWGQIEGDVIMNPQTQIVEVVEAREL